MKKLLSVLLALTLTAALALPAAAAQTQELSPDISVSDDYDWSRFAGKNVVLNVYNWGEYISDGSDGSVDVVSEFQKLTGITVNYTTFDSNESMYAKIKSGAAYYDVIIPSDYMIAKMIKEEMLTPLNYENIPNFAHVDEDLRGRDYDPENRYTVPYMMCTTGIIYNKTMVSAPPTKWADLWDPQYAGNILMFNNSRDAYAIGALKLGMSVNPQTPEDVDLVVEELKKQKSLVQAYVMDEIFDKMEGGEAALGVYYSGDAVTMIADNPDLDWAFPEEGTVQSVDAMCVPATCTNREAAEMFINFMCETDVGVQNCEYVGYTTPMSCVWEELDDELKHSQISYPGSEVEERMQIFSALEDEVNDRLDVDWSEMKSYDDGSSGWMIPVFLVLGVVLAGFNIWRKLRRNLQKNQY